MKIFYNAGDIYKKGVYKIEVNHKHVYIGETNRIFLKRWNEHLNSFSKHTCNKNFKSIINNNCDIEFTVLKQCKTKKQCLKWEKYYINCYQPDLNIKIN